MIENANRISKNISAFLLFTICAVIEYSVLNLTLVKTPHNLPIYQPKPPYALSEVCY